MAGDQVKEPSSSAAMRQKVMKKAKTIAAIDDQPALLLDMPLRAIDSNGNNPDSISSLSKRQSHTPDKTLKRKRSNEQSKEDFVCSSNHESSKSKGSDLEDGAKKAISQPSSNLTKDNTKLAATPRKTKAPIQTTFKLGYPSCVKLTTPNVYTNSAVLAAYHHKESVREFVEWFRDDETAEAWKTMKILKEWRDNDYWHQKDGEWKKHYERLGKSKKVRQSTRVRASDVFELLQSNDVKLNHVANNITTLDFDDEGFAQYNKEERDSHLFVQVLILAACFLLIQNSEDVYWRSTEVDVDANSDPTQYVFGRYHIEDVHRAYSIWRWVNEGPLKKSNNSWPKNMDAANITFKDVDESDVDEEGGYLVPASRADSLIAHPQLYLMNTSRCLAVDPNLSDIYNKYGKKYDSDDKQFEIVDNLFNTINNNAIKADFRTPLTEADRYAVMKIQTEKLVILHDAWSKTSMDETLAGIAEGITYKDAIDAHRQLLVDDMGNADDRAAELSQLRGVMSVGGHKMIPWEEASQELGLETDPKYRDQLQHPILLELNTTVRPSPVQVTGIAHMRRLESTALGGGIIADGHGVGKTIMMLLHIALGYLDLKKRLEAGEKDLDLRPTLIVAPADVVETWYQDWYKWFRNILIFKQYHGSVKDFTKARGTVVLGSQDGPLNDLDVATDFRKQCHPRGLDSARTIVVTSYTTWTKRTLQCTPKLTDDVDDEKSEVENMGSDAGKSRGKGKEKSINDDEETDVETNEDDDEIQGRRKALEDEANYVDQHAKLEPSASSTKQGVNDKKFTYSTNWKHMFRRVVCDEGHFIKNTRNQNNRAILVLFAPLKWVLTATPIINKASDLLGYLTLFWKRSFGVEIPDEPASLYAPDYEYKPIGQCSAKEDDEENSIKAGDPIKYDVASYDEMSGGQRLFVLDPVNFIKMVNKDKLQGTNTTTVLRAISGILQLRRTVATRMTAWNGADVAIGDTIPPYHISFVELQMNSAERLKYESIWQRYSGDLTVVPGKTTAFRNMGIHRLLSLCTFDGRQELFNFMVEQASEGDPKALSVTDWCTKLDGAALYQRFSSDPSNPLQPGRIEMVDYLCAYSPKLRMLCNILLEGKYSEDEKIRGKTLVMCNWSTEIFMTSCLLQLLGIKHHLSQAGMSGQDRGSNHARFNDHEDDHDVLIMSICSTTASINVQHAYHRLVFMSLPPNVNTLVQGIGRIHCVNQKREQYVWVLTVDHTYDQILQANMMNKMIPQILSDAKLKTPDNAELDKK